MNGFVSSPAPPATPPGDPEKLVIGPFWPDVSINHFRDAQRIGGTLIPTDRLREALVAAALSLEVVLGGWRAAQEEAGYTRLADVPSVQIGAHSRLMLLWTRALYALATAELVETHRDITATGAGQAAMPELDQRAEDHRRNAAHAVRDILGKPRTAVELI